MLLFRFFVYVIIFFYVTNFRYRYCFWFVFNIIAVLDIVGYFS